MVGQRRWDQNGNIAIGYSASSATIFPELRYAGRLATNPVNAPGQGEGVLFSGTGSQSGTGRRWGDYSALTVDPVDDCTFWFTSQYYATTSQFKLAHVHCFVQVPDVRWRNTNADTYSDADTYSHTESNTYSDAGAKPTVEPERNRGWSNSNKPDVE